MSNVIRPGRTHYCTATKAVAHGAPCTEDGFVGTAVKKQPAAAGTGLGSSLITTVQVGEKFHIELGGERELTNSRQEGGSFVKGDAVNIRTADNLLTATAANGTTILPYGRVTEVGGEGRGLPSGSPLMRVNLVEGNTR